MSKMLYRGVIFIVLFLCGAVVHASVSVEVSEIMYDLEGADAGREWIEVRNNGGQAVDLAAWKLYENATNHALNPVGSSVVPAGGYALIADDPVKYRADWPSFGGILFGSSFSLGNETETISLRDDVLADVDSVTYRKEDGGAGDGNSLSRSGGGWVASPPSPGGSALPVSPPPPPSSSSASPPPPPSSGGGGSVSTPIPVTTSNPPSSPSSSKMRVEIRGSASAIAGVAGEFEAVGFGLEGKELPNARYIWSFGDGAHAEGARVTHIYVYPGEYVVSVLMSSGEHSAPARLVVRAIRPSVRISDLSAGAHGYVEVANDSGEELDLSGWMIHSANTFTFPRGTVVLPRRTIRIANAVSALAISATGVELLYPNGIGAASSSLSAETPSSKMVITAPISVPSSDPTPARASVETSVRQKIATDVSEKPSHERFAQPSDQGISAFQDIATATPLTSASDSDWPVNKWIVALGGLIALSILGYLFIRPPREPYTDIKILND